ncbi:MAG: hypothetical protein WA061_01870 [Microgenomates group bacterium]
MEKDEIRNVLDEMGLSMTTKFVPWSLSRNAGEKYPSLNYKVTLLIRGKEFLTTDYGMGSGHCPSYKRAFKQSYDERQAVLQECESGFESKGTFSSGYFLPNKKKPILPDIVDVMYSLTLDSDAVECDFEDWCGNYGYEEDSRKAEKIFNECREIGLKLLRVVGSGGLEKLRDLYQDY